jgi:ribonuclease P protein component
MLPKKNRLRRRRDFEEIITKGSYYKKGGLAVKYLRNNLPLSRVAFVVSKKVSNKAVVRNKIKRRLRAVLREWLGEIKKGYDVIFFTQKGIEKKSFPELESEIEAILKETKLISKKDKNEGVSN